MRGPVASLRALWSRLHGSLRRDDALDREMEREMAFHIEMATRRHVERGLTPAAAARQARLEFGSAETFKEDARDAQRARLAENVVADARFALRTLRRAPAFTVAAVLTVALGIGASTAMFTVVNATLLRPLPIPEPDDFTYVGWVWAKGGEIPSLSAFQYEFVRDHNRLFAAVASYRTQEAQLESDAQVRGLAVTGGFFRAMGFAPALGREFDGPELEEGGPAVAILGDQLWRTRFAGDRGILGRQIRLEGEPHTVVGVLPSDFRFPPAWENDGFLVPLAVQADPGDEGHNSDVIARLRAGTPEATRAAELAALTDAFRAAHPSLAPAGEGFKLFSHQDVFVGAAARHTLWVLFGAVSLVLLIACANTATLLLVRASVRQREIAVRASIGAGRARLLQQLLTEGLVLSLSAGALGVLLGVLALRGFVALAPAALPEGGGAPTIDLRVLAYALAVTVGTGLVFGLVAAAPAFRARLQTTLLGGTRGATAGGDRMRESLVFVETAVSVVLLAGATLLIASFGRLLNVDPGFDVDGVTAVRLGRLPAEYDAARRERLADALLERARALPGVERAAIAPNLPLERGMNFPVDIAERPELATGAVELRAVSPEYLATLGIPLRAGRDFDERDVRGAEPVAIVNEAFARHFWGDAPPVGRDIRIGHYADRWIVGPQGQHPTRVVGVAADIHEIGLDRPPRATVLVPRTQVDIGGGPLLLVRGSSAALPEALRAAVAAEEPQLAPQIDRLSAVVSRSVAEPRFRTALVGAFAAFALLLVAIGIYGVIASVVQQRRRDLGIRLALGAQRVQVARAVVQRCLATVGAGTIVGLLVFWAARRVLAPWLFGVTPGDPRVLAVSLAVFALVAALASWVPARRATHIDPASSLRAD